MKSEPPTPPNADQMDILTLASFHRGAIITSYAQVEFLLADLVFRWRKQIRAAEGPLPYSLDSRIKAASEIINTWYRFTEYRAEVEGLIEGLRPFRQIRDMMAHGMMVLTTDQQARHLLDYRMYRETKGGSIEVGRMTTDIDQLAHAASEVGKYAQNFATLWRRIYLDQGLQPVA